MEIGRRTFLRVTGAAVAGGGLEGILAARRAPARAQGTELHLGAAVSRLP